MKRVFLLVLLAATPALADTPNAVTLTMENEAAGVINVPDMTQRECNAAAVLLNARYSGNYGPNYGLSGGNLATIGTYYNQPQTPTTNLRTAKCVVPTATKP